MPGYPKIINPSFTGKVDSSVILPNGTILITKGRNYWLFDDKVTENIVTDGYPRHFSALGRGFREFEGHVHAAYSANDYLYLLGRFNYTKLNPSLEVSILPVQTTV